MKKLAVLVVILSFYACTQTEATKFRIENYIPADTEIFILSPDLANLEVEISSNNFFNIISPTLTSNIQKKLGYLKSLNFKQRAGISFSQIDKNHWNYLLITKKDSSLIILDSISNKSIETLTQNGQTLQKIKIEDDLFYLRETDNANLLSNSKERLLELPATAENEEMADFFKVFNATDPGKTSIIYKGNQLFNFQGKFKIDQYKTFSGWSAIDLDSEKNKLVFNGLSLHLENNFISQLQDYSPLQLEVSKISPKDFISFYSFSTKKNDIPETSRNSFFDQVQEIAFIHLPSGLAVAFNAQEIEAAKEKLTGLATIKEEFRATNIYMLNDDKAWLNNNSFLKDPNDLNYYTVIDHFIIFSETTEPLKKIIAAVQNSNTLENSLFYTNTISSLSSSSSMLMVENLLKNSNQDQTPSSSKIKKFSLGAYQLIADKNFSHLHGIISEPDENDLSLNEVVQQRSIKIKSPLATSPVFFKNHRTDQMDIIVQDANNKLNLISNQGNIFWEKKLDSKINGPVYQVDLFKNGNKQLAFSTGYNLEVIDRTGKDVKPFPVKFNDPLTQPVAVFDYDNNRKYRFVMVQGSNVYMLGPKGKSIKGFDFEKAGSEIAKTPKHIRLGHKDYILIAEQSGKLNILNRQGAIRVPVTEKIEFSSNEWFGNNSKFVSTDIENNLIEISQQGTLKKKNLNLAENHRLVAEEDILVYLNDNELVINGKTVSMDFGLYTSPQIFRTRRKTLISITDTQANKVYVFNKNSDLLNGFPVFGSSEVDIANADLDSKLELVVKGDENEILIYEL